MDGRIDCIVERDCRMRRLVAPRQHHAESPAQPSHDVDVTPGDLRGHDLAHRESNAATSLVWISST